MTTDATVLREAIYSRLSTLRGYKKVRRVLAPQLQSSDLPCLSISIVGEDMTEDGNANTGEPHFVSSITIGISVVRGFDDPVTLDGQIDADVDAIETMLLTDPSFVPPSTSYPPPSEPEPAIFEAVTRIKRSRLYPFDGETYFCELRLEMTFEMREIFVPLTPDEFKKLRMTTRPFGHSDAPAITSEFNVPQ